MKLKLIILLLLPYFLVAQQEFRLYGSWKTCLTKKKNKIEDCSGDSYSTTFTFLEDGTYITDDTYQSLGKEYTKHGTWSYDGKLLARNPINKNGISRGEFKVKIKWINEELFFIKGREGKFGPMFYIGFHKQ